MQLFLVAGKDCLSVFSKYIKLFFYGFYVTLLASFCLSNEKLELVSTLHTELQFLMNEATVGGNKWASLAM